MKRWHVGLWAASACLAGWLAGARAQAAPSEREKAAEAHSKAAKVQYKDGHYAEAAAEFERALDLFPNPTLLFNLAQAHRHAGANERAIFFFKRYLIMAPKEDKSRPMAEARIRELEAGPARPVAGARGDAPAAAPNATAAAPAVNTPPAATPPNPAADDAPIVISLDTPAAPSAAPRPVAAPVAQEPPFAAEDLIEDAGEQPPPRSESRFRLLAHVGLATPTFGGRGTDAKSDPAAFVTAISATVALPFALGALDVGMAGTWTPVSYKNAKNRLTNLSQLWGGYATTTLRFNLGQGWSLGPTLALGVVWWAGISDDNLFTESGMGTGSAVPMPSVRLGLPLVWRMRGQPLLLGIEPAWSFSRASTPDLAEKTESLRWLGLNGVIGFAF
jgi:hypothetical protein